MSDDLPKLRLRSSLPPDPAAPPPTAPGLDAPPPPGPPTAPHAWLAADVPAFPEIPREPVPGAPPPPPPLPADSAEMPPPADASKPRMALRPRAAGAPPPPPPVPARSTPPLFTLPVTRATTPGFATRPPGQSIPPLAPIENAASSDVAAAGKKVQRAALGIAIAGVVIFAVAGMIAYRNLSSFSQNSVEEREPRPTAAARKSPQPVPPPDDEEEPAAPEAAAAVPPPQAKKNSSPAKPKKISAPPPVVATVPESTAADAPTGPATASAAFQAWVSNLKISGVRSGERPRIVVASKLYKIGETMNAELGIVFDGYDAARHIVRFRDAAGAVIEREDR